MKKPVNNVDDITNSVYTRIDGFKKIPHDWWGMPEFIQPTIHPYAEIDVYFESEDDVVEFSKLIDQEFISKKTKHTWFPRSERARKIARWIQED